MSDSKLRRIKTSPVPSLSVPGNAALSTGLKQIAELLNVRFGQSGQIQDQAVTWGDLFDKGLVSMRTKNGDLLKADTPPKDIVPRPPHEIVDGYPPAPTGLIATPALEQIIIQWDPPSFDYYGYAEVWRSETDNLSEASYIGQTTGFIYADYILSTEDNRNFYYWIRFISKGGKQGPFNAVSGAEAPVSIDPEYMLEVLSRDDPNAILYQVPKGGLVIGDVTVPEGVYIKDAFIADGTITRAKIGLAAIDDARIANLSAAKITFGEMHGDRIKANTINADRITTSTLIASLASISVAYIKTAHIEDGTITTAKIKDASIVDAKIQNLSAAKITFGEMSGDRIQTNSLNANRIIASTLATQIALINTAYIKTANIYDAAITNAKIANLAVDTLKIAGNAVTIPVASNFSGTNTVSITANFYGAPVVAIGYVYGPGGYNNNYPVHIGVPGATFASVMPRTYSTKDNENGDYYLDSTSCAIVGVFNTTGVITVTLTAYHDLNSAKKDLRGSLVLIGLRR